jgi:NAD(P)-dependent dehydrogenase (short-subunit alcohol dehydrogenase family)
MDSEFADRLVVVTGVSSGIGLALTAQLLQQGARVLGMARRVLDLQELQALQQSYPQQLLLQAGDVTRSADLQALRQRAAQLGGVDHLVACAGCAELAGSLDQAAFERQWAVNGAGALNTLAVLRGVLGSNSSVVFLGSVLGQTGLPGLAAYSAGKAALITQVRTLAAEFAALGVRINLVSPGPTATALWDGLGLHEGELEQLAERLGQRLLPGHFLDAAAVARVIVFQLSQGARGVYGQDWVVDNGYSLN